MQKITRKIYRINHIFRVWWQTKSEGFTILARKEGGKKIKKEADLPKTNDELDEYYRTEYRWDRSHLREIMVYIRIETRHGWHYNKTNTQGLLDELKIQNISLEFYKFVTYRTRDVGFFTGIKTIVADLRYRKDIVRSILLIIDSDATE